MKFKKLSLIGASFVAISSLSAVALATSCNQSKDNSIAELVYIKIKDGSGYQVVGIKNANANIKTITVPSTYEGKPVLSIKEGALKNCPNLTTLNIPFIGASADAAGIEGMLGYVFGKEMYEGCGGYTWQEMEDESGTTIYGQYAIPSDLAVINVTNATRIPDGAFSMCKHIETVNIKNSADKKVKEIGNKAFYYCSSIDTFDWSFADELETIGASAFENCLTLQEIKIPSSVKTINKRAFASCISAARAVIPNKLNSVNSAAFTNFIGGVMLIENSEKEIEQKGWASDWTDPTTVTFYEYRSQEGYVYLDDFLYIICGKENDKYAYCSQYMGAWGQESVVIPSEITLKDGVTKYPVRCIGCKIFNEDTNLKKVTIEEAKTDGQGIHYIFPCAFNGCSSLKYVNFPSSLKEVRTGAFQGCASLTGHYNASTEEYIDHIDLKNVTIIGDNAFYGCASASKFKIENVVTIGTEAFAHCYHLGAYYDIDAEGTKTSGSFVIPETCTSIGEGAFKYSFKYAPSGAPSGVYYPSVKLSSKLVNVPESAFEACGVRSTTSSFEEDKGKTYPKQIRVNVDLNDAPLTRIENKAFKNMWIYRLSGARKTALKYIGDYSFYYAQPISDAEAGKTDLQIDQECEYVGEYAFAYCTTIESLTFLTIEDKETGENKHSLQHLGQYAFYGINNTNFTEVDLSPCLDLRTSYDKLAEEKKDYSKTCRYAFAQCPYLQIVKLPGTDAMLAEPKGYKTKIRYDEEGKPYKAELTTEAQYFTEISERMFEGDTNIGKDVDRTPMRIAKHTTTLRAYAFNGCTFLTNCFAQTDAEHGIKHFGTCLFRNCQHLQHFSKEEKDEGGNYKDIDIAKDLIRDKIGSNIYENCYKLVQAPIPSQIITDPNSSYYYNINGSAFINCANLTKIKIPSEVAVIGTNAFQGCIKLSDVEIAEPQPGVAGRLSCVNTCAFYYCTSLKKFNMENTVAFAKGYSSTFTINTSAFAGCTELGKINNWKQDSQSVAHPEYKFWLPKSNLSMGTKPFEEWTGDQVVFFRTTNVYGTDAQKDFKKCIDGSGTISYSTLPKSFKLRGTTSWTFNMKMKDSTTPETITIDGVNYTWYTCEKSGSSTLKFIYAGN